MTIIRNLVTVDEHAEFRNDVQLSDYEKPETNLALLKSYLFTTKAPQGQESSIGILRAIIESFLNQRLDNRITTIANYGHGKSHLALVLANYFGKAYDSPEMEVIFSKIDQSFDNPASRKRFHEFRENRKEFLVIRLRGDKPQNLREQFVMGLEQALKEHPSTRSVELPFWYQKAEKLLSDLSGSQLSKANQFLESFQTDVSALIQDVKQRKDFTYDVCIKLFTELHGVPPNLKGEVSQREIINWVSRSFCGDEKPLGGIFILFDEFSLYIQRYGQRNAAGELQDLLNGIEDQKGRSVFVAFAQHDPIVIARNTLKSGERLETLEHELTRIPRKVILYSLMESVINAYLKQPEAAWQNFRSDSQVRGPLARSSNLTMDLFSKRYEQVLNWDTEQFDEIVTKGCFPLHPLTTALLCDLRLQGMGSVGNPRTVLGFVFEQVHQKRDEDVITNGKVNWVYPIFLVDYFHDYLPENSFALYENAVHNLDPEAPDEQKDLLKALLLQDIARLPVRRDTQVNYLAEAVGIRPGEADRHLRKLSGDRVIRYDQATQLYSFYPVTANPHRMEELIDERLRGYKLTWDLLKKLNNSLLRKVPVDIPWGNSDDWAADELILTLEFFTAQKLRELVPNYRLTTTGDLEEGKRGCIIWLLGETDEEVNALRRNASNTLEEAFADENPPAIIIVLPKRPCPNFVTTNIKNQIVESFNQDNRNEVGVEIYTNEVNRLKLQMLVELENLRGDRLSYSTLPHSNARYVVPNAYRVGIQSLGEISINRLLQELYKLAYRFSPPEFFKEFKVGGAGVNNLRTATKSVANVLLRNGVPRNREAIFAQPVAKRLCETFLQQKWQLLMPDFRIREPGNSRVLEAWNFIEKAMPAGVKERKVRDLIIKLLNPPYGYDYHTAALLFSAWVGFHSHDVQISMQNRLVPMDKLSEHLTESANLRNFIVQISSEQHLAITRRDSAQQEREINEIIETAKKDSFTQKDASEAITKLDEFCREKPEASIYLSAKQTSENLTLALKQAILYDGQFLKIQAVLQNERNIGKVLELHQEISNLVRPTLVRQTAPEESEIHASWLNRITQLIEQECASLVKVNRITDIGLNQQRLLDLKNHLRKVNLPVLQKMVEESGKVLSEKQKEFEAQEREMPLQNEIRGMDPRESLIRLYQYRDRLKQIKNTSAATAALKDEQLRKIEQAISDLELFADQLIKALSRIDSQDASNDWQRKRLRNYDRFIKSAYEKDLEAADQLVKNLQILFQAIETISKRRPKSFIEARGMIFDLERLKGNTEFNLSECQLELIEKGKREIDVYVRIQVQAAKSWYQNIIEKYKSGGSIAIILEKLKDTPPFLPEEEAKNIDLIRLEIGKMVEQDIITSIEFKFRELRDPATRRLCLDKLRKIMDEELS